VDRKAERLIGIVSAVIGLVKVIADIVRVKKDKKPNTK
jgi:hypothetical protein